MTIERFEQAAAAHESVILSEGIRFRRCRENRRHRGLAKP